jgi:hypothetical protein
LHVRWRWRDGYSQLRFTDVISGVLLTGCNQDGNYGIYRI